jgi:hypothetical protein
MTDAQKVAHLQALLEEYRKEISDLRRREDSGARAQNSLGVLAPKGKRASEQLLAALQRRTCSERTRDYQQ